MTAEAADGAENVTSTAASPAVSWRSTLRASAVVFVLAVLVRLPACGESFWLDELHTAWTIHDGPDRVLPRASLGHQTPTYFVTLWGWQALFGGGEATLRFSSVVATSLAAAVLCGGLARVTSSLPAGLVAAAVLAIERNAIFFGTELRPYAWIVFLSAGAILCFAALGRARSRHDHPGLWFLLIACCLAAAWIQPTSLGVLAWLPLALLALWGIREPNSLRPVTRADIALLAVAGVGLWGLWSAVLAESWRERTAWAAFASADSLNQIRHMWAWGPLWIAPVAVSGFARWRAGDQPRHRISAWFTLAMLLATLTAVVTLLAWAVAYAGWLPVWHRRYLVALLPAFAALCGLAVSGVGAVIPGRSNAADWIGLGWIGAGWMRAGWTLVTGSLLVGWLGFRQSTFESLARRPSAVVRRGEDWRGAVRWVNRRLNSGDRLLVDAGLIEATAYLKRGVTPRPGTTSDQLRYLCFPVLGPYRPDREISIAPLGLAAAAASGADLNLPGEDHHLFVISRRRVTALSRILESWLSDRQEIRIQIAAFGGVSAARLALSERDD